MKKYLYQLLLYLIIMQSNVAMEKNYSPKEVFKRLETTHIANQDLYYADFRKISSMETAKESMHRWVEEALNKKNSSYGYTKSGHHYIMYHANKTLVTFDPIHENTVHLQPSVAVLLNKKAEILARMVFATHSTSAFDSKKHTVATLIATNLVCQGSPEKLFQDAEWSGELLDCIENGLKQSKTEILFIACSNYATSNWFKSRGYGYNTGCFKNRETLGKLLYS